MASPGFTADRTLYQAQQLYFRHRFKRSSGGVRPAIAIEMMAIPTRAPRHTLAGDRRQGRY